MSNLDDPDLKENPYGLVPTGIDAVFDNGNPKIRMFYEVHEDRLKTVDEELFYYLYKDDCKTTANTNIINVGGRQDADQNNNFKIASGIRTITKDFILNTDNIYDDESMLKKPGGATFKKDEDSDHFEFHFCVRTDLRIKDYVTNEQDEKGDFRTVSADISKVTAEIELKGSFQDLTIKTKKDEVQSYSDKHDQNFSVVAFQCDTNGNEIVKPPDLPPNSWLRVCIRSDDPLVDVYRVQKMELFQGGELEGNSCRRIHRRFYHQEAIQ